MAKDPAFLFYPADASQDTQFMNRLERGAYFDLVKGQRMYGGYTVVQLRKILGNDFESVWPALELVMEFDGERYHIGWLKSSISKREEYSKKQSERVSKRWNNGGNTVVLPKKENEIVNGTVIGDKSKIETEKPKREIFKRPEMQEVLEWMRTANSVAGNLWKDERVMAEAKKFWNYYESNGWKVGKNPMKKWDAAARNWMNNANKFDNNNGKQGFNGTRLAGSTGNRIHDEHHRRAAEVVDHLRRKFEGEKPVDSGNENPTTDSGDYVDCEVID